MKRLLREILPDRLYRIIRNAVVDRRDHRIWRSHRRHPQVPPPHIAKVKTVIDCARRHRIRTLIETGTFEGEMVRKCRRSFDTVHTIELSDRWARRAKDLFAGDDRVHVHHGDSAVVLPQVLRAVREPAVFWLDGHYSGEGTARGATDTPLLEELSAIQANGTRGSVILVDDARCLGTPGYPSLGDVETLLRAIEPHGLITVTDDIVRCEPRLPDRG